MSLYVEWLNQIKLKANSTWLTKSQCKALSDALNKYPQERFVCLVGCAGSGKTFISWIMVKEYGYIYANELSKVDSGVERVVIDGGQYSRAMRPVAQLLGLKRVVVLTERKPPARDGVPVITLSLDEHDVRQFQHNLTKYDILKSFLGQAEGTDLSQILRNEAISRGGSDVD